MVVNKKKLLNDKRIFPSPYYHHADYSSTVFLDKLVTIYHLGK